MVVFLLADGNLIVGARQRNIWNNPLQLGGAAVDAVEFLCGDFNGAKRF